MHEEVNVFESKRETVKILESYLKSEVAIKESSISIDMAKAILFDLKELLQISINLYNQNLKNISEKNRYKNRLEIIEELNGDYSYVNKEFLG